MSEALSPPDVAHRKRRAPTQRWYLSLLALFVWGAVSCGADGPDGIGTAAGSTTSVSSSDVADTSTVSGVGVIAEGCSLIAQLGSGVVLGNGVVVTVAHTIAGATSVLVEDHAGNEHTASVSAFDPDADLAVLDVPTLNASPLTLGPVRLGNATLVRWDRADGVGAIVVEVSKRLTITIEDIYTQDTVRRSGLEIIGSVESGDSGGPVVDTSGSVIGIVYANSRDRGGVGFATDITEIERVLAEAATANPAVPADNGRCF